jgi:hypothetical protein
MDGGGRGGRLYARTVDGVRRRKVKETEGRAHSKGVAESQRG